MPLRSIETEEQRQQRFLQEKLARQATEQEIKQGLSSLPGQAAWMGGLMLPTSGITDYSGLYPEAPTGKGMTGETMPSFGENIQNKEYLSALYQFLGLGGDLALGAGVFYPPLLPLAAAMKTTSAIGKAAKASKQGKLLPKYKIDEKGEVLNADILEIKLPKSYKTRLHARYAETADGKFIMHPSFGSYDNFGFFDKGTVGLPKVSDPVFDSLDDVKVALIDRALESGKINELVPETAKIHNKLKAERSIPVKPDDILELPAEKVETEFVISGVDKAAKTTEQGAMAARILPRYMINEHGVVTNADVLQINLPKSYNLKIQARYAETPDGQIILAPEIMGPTFGSTSPLSESSLVYNSLDQAKTGLIDYALHSGLPEPGASGWGISKTQEKMLSKAREKLEVERPIPVQPDETGIIDENFNFIPFTEALLETEMSIKGFLPKLPRKEVDRIYEEEATQDPRLLEGLYEAAARRQNKTVSEIVAETQAGFEAPIRAEPPPFAIAEPRIGATADELLDWQKPLTEQQPAVQEKIKNLIGEDFFNQAVADGHTGEEVYNRFNDAMLRDDLAQYGLEFLEPSLSTEKLGAGAYLNEAGIKGIVYDRGSVDVFDPLKYKKVDPGAKLPKSLQTPKKPAALTNKRESVHTLLKKYGGFDPSEKFQEELWASFPEPYMQKKSDKYGGFKMHESVPRWARSKQSKHGEFTGMRSMSDFQELLADTEGFAHHYEGKGGFAGSVEADNITADLLLKDELIPEQADELLKWNKTVEEQERTIDLLESGGYTPEGMTEEEVDIALKKIFADQETVEVEVFDFSDDDIPEFNSGGPVTKPLYANRRYI